MAFIDKTIEVGADVRDVYDIWTAFEDFPTFMETIETVTVGQDDRQHWVAVVEDDTYEWDADLVEHVEDEKVVWQAIDGRETGEVRFEKLAGGRTKVTYQLEYDPDAWDVPAATLEQWMNSRVDEDLQGFKRAFEAAA
jgi:uncharacterized membrane protein